MSHLNYQNTNKGYTTPTCLEEQEWQTVGLEEAQKNQLDLYYQGRDKVVVHQPKQSTETVIREEQFGTVIRLAKPLAAGVAIASGAGIIVNTAIGIGAAVLQFINANALLIGGSFFAIGLIYSAALAFFQKQPKQAGPNDSGEWEFYQKQEQGWRRKEK
jgi:hypothetical protein